MDNYEQIGKIMVQHAINTLQMKPLVIYYAVESYLNNRDVMFEIVSHNYDQQAEQNLKQMRINNH